MWFLSRLDRNNTKQHGGLVQVLTRVEEKVTRLDAKSDHVESKVMHIDTKMDGIHERVARLETIKKP